MIALDTDIVSNLLRPRPSRLLVRRLTDVPVTEQATTSVTVGELSYGAHKADRLDILQRALRLLAGVRVFSFDGAAALTYGELRAALERDGMPLADPDLRIAAIAVAHDLTLITRNVRHFARVPGLTVENWLAG